MALTRRRVAVTVVACLLVVGAGLLTGIGIEAARSGGPAATTTVPDPTAVFVPVINRAVAGAERAVAIRLPNRLGAPAPTLASGAFPTPLARHQVLGFLAYWEVGSFTPDYAGLTTVAYFAVDVARGGAIDKNPKTDPGWATFTGPALATDVAQAHAAGDRVLLTTFADSTKVLHSLAQAPGASAARLSAAVATQLRAKGLDGVDLDLEGTHAADRGGFVRFVAAFSTDLRRLDPAWSIVLNTFAGSAFDSTGFFDVKALWRHVDELFVMAYDMQSGDIPSATAPLTGASMSDALALAEYTSIVPASHLVLGIPLYGYDFPSSRRTLPAVSTGPPVAVTYAAVVAARHKPLWDPATETPWTSVHRDRAWHQTWFDDPVSVALKTALAAQFRCAGVGVWELGMSGGDPKITSALLGRAAPVKLPLASAAS